MSDQDGTLAGAQAVDVGPKGANPSSRPRQRGATPVPSTEWADVNWARHGLLLITDTHINPEVTKEDLELADRRTQVASIKTYFTTPVEIFSSANATPRITGWPAEAFDFVNLWPEPLERRLHAYDARRFGATDADMRSLIDTTIKVFEYNVLRYMTLKRIWQAVAILGIVLTTYFLVAIGQLMTPSFPFAALAPVGAAVIIPFIMLGYIHRNDVLNERMDHAVKDTVDMTSRPIEKRMDTIATRIEEYASDLNTLLRKGETLEALRDGVDDRALAEGHAFKSAQMMLWLPIRVLGIEWALRNRMETAEKRHSIYAFIGFLISGALLAFFVLLQIAAVMAASAIGLLDLPIVQEPQLTVVLHWSGLILSLAAMLAALAATFRISHLSYYRKSWNPAKHLLEKYFTTEKWSTFSRLEMDVRLAARVQRAMQAISDLDKKRR